MLISLRRNTMRSLRKPLFVFALFVLIATGALLIPSLSISASAQFPCTLFICKEAPGAGDQSFLIDIIDFTGTTTEELFDGGRCREVFYDFQNEAEIIEQNTPGWILTDVDCDPISGFSITSIPGGIATECIAPGETTCTFVNSRGPTNIPTLSEWGMMAAAGGLILVGVFFMLYRRRAANV